MAIEINHFSHTEHPLILSKESHKKKSSTDELVVCYGCGIAIADCDDDDDKSAGYYECATCNLCLHKQCAEAPTQINHPMHSLHPLNLLSHPPYQDSVCICNVCGRDDWKWFTYNCSHCELDIDIICSFKVDRNFEHKSHPHSLTSQLREALFLCDACGTESKDLSYLCTTCPFWIHKSCGLLPTTNKFSHHHHNLQLAYSFPHSYRQFISDCDICRQKLHPIYWLYYCANCRYFVHLKCATTPPAIPEQRDDQGEEDLLTFPIDDRAPVLTQFLKKMSLLEEDADFNIAHGETMMDHPDHSCNLQLILSDNDGQSKNDGDELKKMTNIVNYDGMLCAACNQTITPPFYHCGEHSYFLHRYCALLPLELQHPAHPDHPLKISKVSNCFDYWKCGSCYQCHSGFSYGCKTCKVYICITCACLPTKIRHEFHQHPLVSGKVSNCLCDASNAWFDGMAYKCETESCTYNLHHIFATKLPRTLTQYYDEHPLYLTCPPIEDHPNDYYCEICEEDIHPKFWLYYCHKCSYSFHIECLYPSDRYSNVKFGDMYEMENHQHPLTLIRNGGIESPCLCGSCGKDRKRYPVLECSECDIKICIVCAREGNCERV